MFKLISGLQVFVSNVERVFSGTEAERADAIEALYETANTNHARIKRHAAKERSWNSNPARALRAQDIREQRGLVDFRNGRQEVFGPINELGGLNLPFDIFSHSGNIHYDRAGKMSYSDAA